MHNTHKHVHNTHTHIVANNKINTFNIYLFNFISCVCAWEYVCGAHPCRSPQRCEAGIVFRETRVTRWVLGSQSGSSTRVVITLNCRVNSPTHKINLLKIKKMSRYWVLKMIIFFIDSLCTEHHPFYRIARKSVSWAECRFWWQGRLREAEKKKTHTGCSVSAWLFKGSYRKTKDRKKERLVLALGGACLFAVSGHLSCPCVWMAKWLQKMGYDLQ